MITGGELDFKPDNRGLGWEFYRCMNRHKNKTAQIFAETSQRETYGEVLERSIRLSINLKKKGLKPGDILLMYSDNHLDSCIPWISGLFLGCKVATIDPKISLGDTTHLINQIKEETKIIFTIAACEDLIEQALEMVDLQVELVVFGYTNKNTPFGDLLDCTIGEISEFRPNSDVCSSDTAVIFFSSGSTGLPKGICASHYALACQSYNFTSSGYNLKMALSYASLYWISSALIQTGSILCGGSRLLCSKFDPEELWYLIDKFKTTIVFLSPTLAIYMLNNDRPEGINTISLLDVIIGGGPLGPNFLEKLRDLLPGTNVSLVYGQTEATGILTGFKPNIRKDLILMLEKPGSSGRVCPGISYRVVDPETKKILGPQEKGELQVKTDFSMIGYYKKDSSSAWEDGWLKTGDIVYYDEDECFYIVDRLKELLKYRGFHVVPAAIEAVLQGHPAVHSGVVIGIPDDIDGDHAMGVVVLKKDSTRIKPVEIEEYVNSKMDDIHQIRAGIKIVEEIPMTATGKFRKNHLRQLVLKQEI